MSTQLADLPSDRLARLHFVVPEAPFLFRQLNHYPYPKKEWHRLVACLRAIDRLALVAIDQISAGVENLPRPYDDDFAHHLRKRLHITQGQLHCPVAAFE